MGVSFLKLWENMQAEDYQSNDKTQDFGDGPPLLDSGEDSKAMETIRAGINVNNTFWDDFMKVCNNAEGLGELLNVPPDQISAWPAKIRDNLDKVDQKDAGSDSKHKLVSTGDTEPIADQGEGPVTAPQSTNPTP